MRTDPRPQAITAGGFFGGCACLVQAAFADDPFKIITTSTIALSLTLLVLYVVEGHLYRRRTEKERSCRPN